MSARVVFVTGSSTGIGEATALHFARLGDTVYATMRTPDRSGDTLRAASQLEGLDLTLVALDVNDEHSVARAVGAALERSGHIDVLVNNAGIDQPPDTASSRSDLRDLPIDEFRRMVEVNLLGTFQVTQVFGSMMAERGAGSIINIGSLYASVSPDSHFYDHLAGDVPFIKSPAYGASKAGVVNLSKFFATHWAPSGVRVNTLSPGGVLAGQDEQFKAKYGSRVPLGRMARPEDLKGPLVFLASAASSYVTGHELHVDGGFTAW